jgi:hypothetical protein
MVNLDIYFALPEYRNPALSPFSNHPNFSNAPNRRCSAPEQHEQQTNISVHGKKRSVQLA